MTHKVIIHYPYKCFSSTSGDVFKDLDIFYTNLQKVLINLNITYTMIDTMAVNYNIANPDPNKIYLGYQIYDIINKNIWCIKTSYLPGYVYMDPTGYSKWAYITSHKELFDKSQTMDFKQSQKTIHEYAAFYKNNNLSRLPQPKKELVHLSMPYFLYTYQNWYDDNNVYAIANYLHINGYKLVVKYHPKLRQNSRTLLPHDNIIIKNDSIHALIPNASGIISTNSGVCFEALLYDKHIFTFGESDYEYVTHKLTIDTINTIIPLSMLPFNYELIYKYIYYLMEHYWVNVTDVNKIQNRMQKILENSTIF